MFRARYARGKTSEVLPRSSHDLSPAELPHYSLHCIQMLAERSGDEPGRLNHAIFTQRPNGLVTKLHITIWLVTGFPDVVGLTPSRLLTTNGNT